MKKVKVIAFTLLVLPLVYAAAQADDSLGQYITKVVEEGLWDFPLLNEPIKTSFARGAGSVFASLQNVYLRYLIYLSAPLFFCVCGVVFKYKWQALLAAILWVFIVETLLIIFRNSMIPLLFPVMPLCSAYLLFSHNREEIKIDDTINLDN